MLRRLLAIVHRALGVSDVRIGPDLYMRRYRLVHARGWGVRIHHLVRSDDERGLHDHPFWFLSIILAGGYTEHLADGSATWHGPGSVLFRTATTLHRLVVPRPVWTLVIRGPYVREWGFQTPSGWVAAEEYGA